MIAVIQRAFGARVFCDGEFGSEISRGLYILLGIMRGDDEKDADLLAEKISKLRIFSDEAGKMNLSINDVDGEAMVVSNFTLGANYAHGNRPNYFGAAAPDEACALYEFFVLRLSERVRRVTTGGFGADMRTELETDGPVTIVMNSEVLRGGKNDFKR